MAVAVLATIPTATSAAGTCRQTMTTALIWRDCAERGVWIVETRRSLTAFFAPAPVPTLRARMAVSPGPATQARQPAAMPALLVNAGYHDGNYADARPEGLLVIDGTVIAALKPGDRQLTHVLSIDVAGTITAIRPAIAGAVQAPGAGMTQVQSGPLITEDGQPTLRWIAGSLNGTDAYKRTAIGRTRDGATVIVIARMPCSLPALARIVLAAGRYRARGLTLLNLDGGPSTAIHADIPSGLSYGADKVTPVGFAVAR